jgi:hypothetical protein
MSALAFGPCAGTCSRVYRRRSRAVANRPVAGGKNVASKCSKAHWSTGSGVGPASGRASRWCCSARPVRPGWPGCSGGSGTPVPDQTNVYGAAASPAPRGQRSPPVLRICRKDIVFCSLIGYQGSASLIMNARSQLDNSGCHALSRLPWPRESYDLPMLKRNAGKSAVMWFQ